MRLVRNVSRLLTVVLFVVGAFQAAPALAETDQETYDRLLREMRETPRVKFLDDTNELNGRAYNFAKSLGGYFGLDVTLDAADFARSVTKEGLNRENVLTLVATLAVKKGTSPQVKELLGGLDQQQLVRVLDRADEIAGPEARAALLGIVTQDAPKGAGQAAGGTSAEGLETVLAGVIGKLCKPCDNAYHGVKLAEEAVRVYRNYVDNERTQQLFRALGKFEKGEGRANTRKYFLEEYARRTIHYNEARRALAEIHRAAGKGAPSNAEVEQFIWRRYERWQNDKAASRADADLLEQVRDYYLRLQDYEKEDMFGPGSEEKWSETFQDEYAALYRRLVALRGDNPWPGGMDRGRQPVRWEAYRLLKRWFTEDLSDMQVEYELRVLAAGWGWIAKADVPPPPPPPPPPGASHRDDDPDARRAHIMDRLVNLNHYKLSATVEAMGLDMPVEIMGCLCASYGVMGAGVSYRPEPWGDCNNTKPCKGGNWGCVSHDLPHDPAVWERCLAEHPVRFSEKNGADAEEIRFDELIERTLRERRK